MPKTFSVLLVGCGKMGGALLDGWLSSSTPTRVVVMDRHRTQDDPAYTTVRKVEEIPSDFTPDIIVLAVKPDVACQALTDLCKYMGARLSKSAALSMMAGITCKTLKDSAKSGGADLPVLRAMPNTPAAIGSGTSGFYCGPDASTQQQQLCEKLLSAVGSVVRVTEETDLSAVTAVSGSGPAYVFLLAELLEKAGIEQGLSAETARELARGTVYGAGQMLKKFPDQDASDLRVAVTSPKGTTAAALDVLMSPTAWPKATKEAVKAAKERAEELSR